MANGQGVNSRRFAQTAYDIVAPTLRKAAGKPDGGTPAGGTAPGSAGGAAADRETLMRFNGHLPAAARGRERGAHPGKATCTCCRSPPTIRWTR